MSNFYNMLFGNNADQSGFLLSLLELTRADFGRYRDIYVTEDHIVVYTRCGGGNREDYEDVFDEMEDHPLFDYDEDDDFDFTYASFYFKHPEEYSDLLKEMAQGTITPSEKWEALLGALNAK